MGMLIGTMLFVAGVLMLAGAAGRAMGERKVRWWARREHAHRWRAIRASYEPSGLTSVVEECRRCPALQHRLLPGAWMVNRIGELSPVESVSEAAQFERMMR